MSRMSWPVPQDAAERSELCCQADGDDMLGDGVIIASRLEPLAEPGGICISARVREDAAGKMALEADDLGTPEMKNISAKIQVFRVRLGAAERLALPLPDKPSLVVLPFRNMSGDPEQEYFADGMVEEITTALSRIRLLFVIARNSAFTYKGRAVDVRQVGRELGVRYVLEGSVRKAGTRVRITGQLMEADRLNPLNRTPFFYFVHALAHFVAGEHEAVVEWTAKALQERSNYAAALRYRAASLGLLDRLEEGRQVVQRLLTLAPDFTISRARRHIEYNMNNIFKNSWRYQLALRGATTVRSSGVTERQALKRSYNASSCTNARSYCKRRWLSLSLPSAEQQSVLGLRQVWALQVWQRTMLVDAVNGYFGGHDRLHLLLRGWERSKIRDEIAQIAVGDP